MQISLEVAPPLESFDDPSAISLGLAGDHQRINAALAVALCQKWTERAGAKAQLEALDQVRGKELESTRSFSALNLNLLTVAERFMMFQLPKAQGLSWSSFSP